jgi:U3 small nucleolar RNA-associated protein 12
MEVWTLDLDAEQQLLFTGSSEGELKAWKVDKDALAEGIKETSSGEVCTPLSGLVCGAESPSRS